MVTLTFRLGQLYELGFLDHAESEGHNIGSHTLERGMTDMNGHSRGKMVDKVIVVTGASSGIGRAAAMLLGGQGAKLGLIDWVAPSEVVEEIKSAGGEATAFQCDVRSREQVDNAIQSTVEKYGPLNGEVWNL